MGSGECAFVTTINPESAPFHAKTLEAAGVFRELRDGLSARGIRTGILVQTSLGHSERGLPRTEAPFQRTVGLNRAESVAFCPLDDGFIAHVAASVRTLAEADPEFVLIDDDYQLFAHRPAVPGCFCPLHVDLFNRTAGTEFRFEELAARLAMDDDEGETTRRQWFKVEYESLARLAVVIRNAIDQHNPEIPCGICSTRHNLLHNAGLAKALAGPHRAFVRVGGNVYLERSAKDLPLVYDHIARQIKAMPAEIEVLTEADTFPHHHYSVSAVGLKAHLVSSAVVGCQGAKAWVLPIASGQAHRNEQFVDVYRKSRQFLSAVQKAFAGISWQGVSVEQSNREAVLKPWNANTQRRFIDPLWALVFGRLGIPHVPGGGPSRIRAFAGDDVECYDDGQWEEFFSGGVLLDGAAAGILTKRGFSNLMGVEAVSDEAFFCSAERYADDERWNGSYRGALQASSRSNPSDALRLRPTSDTTMVLGDYIVRPWRLSKQIHAVAPSVVGFENSEGGRVAVFAAGLARLAESHFINPGRRRQLQGIVSWIDGTPTLLWPNFDTDVYFLQGSVGDGPCGILLYFLNLQADPINSVSLSGRIHGLEMAERLFEDGQWREVPLRLVEDHLEINLELRYLDPVIIRL